MSFQSVQLAPMHGDPGTPILAIVEAAAAAGFEHVGLDLWSLAAHGAHGGDMEEVEARIAELGLGVTDLVGLVVRADGPSIAVEAVRWGSVAQRLRIARCVLAVDASVPDWRDRGVVRQVAEAAATLAECGVRLAVEFMPYSSLRGVAEAVELCELVSAPAGLCLDSFHVSLGNQLDAVRNLDPAMIDLVQLCDAVILSSDTIAEMSRHGRELPGRGELPLEDFVRVLTELRYEGPISGEVLSRAVRSGPPMPFAEDSLRALRDYWSPTA